jgi:hypothetical protein
MKFASLALLALLWMGAAIAQPSQDDAVAASKTWLAAVDAGQYPESWKDAAEFFQQGVSEAKWDSMVQSARDSLGPLKSREFQAAELTKTLPGVPTAIMPSSASKAFSRRKPTPSNRLR